MAFFLAFFSVSGCTLHLHRAVAPRSAMASCFFLTAGVTGSHFRFTQLHCEKLIPPPLPCAIENPAFGDVKTHTHTQSLFKVLKRRTGLITFFLPILRSKTGKNAREAATAAEKYPFASFTQRSTNTGDFRPAGACACQSLR